MNGSVMVKRVPSRATRVRPSATRRSAAASPMWSTGTRTCAGNRVIALVDGVAGDDQAFRAAASRAAWRASITILAMPSQSPANSIAAIVREIEAFDGQRRAVQAAEALRDAAIDMLVIKRGRRPAHAPDDAQLAQSMPLPA